jgi:hypothetical protein
MPAGAAPRRPEHLADRAPEPRADLGSARALHAVPDMTERIVLSSRDEGC